MVGKFTRVPKGLGHIVLYGTSSKVHLTYAQVKSEMDKHALRSSFLRKPSEKSAFTRCAKEIEKKYLNKFARKVIETADEKIVVVVLEKLKKNKRGLNFIEDTRAIFNKKTKKLIVDGTNEEDITELFNHYSKYVTGDDIRKMARNVVEDSQGISLRGGTFVKDTGGVYFIPKKYTAQIEALSDVLEKLKIGYLKAFSVTKGKVEQLALYETSVGFIKKEIDRLEKSIENIKKKVGYLRKHLNRLNRLRMLLSHYEKLAGMENKAKDLFNRIQKVEDKINKKINSLSSK